MKGFLDSYIDTFYSEDFVNQAFASFEDYIFGLRDDVLELISKLNDYALPEIVEKNEKSVAEFAEASSYDELLDTLSFRLAQNRNGAYDDEAKEISPKIADARKKLKLACSFGDKKC